jgi:hypothetical protein
MSLSGILETALTPIAPAEAGSYSGTEPIYIVFSYASSPDNFADNAPEHEVHLVQVELSAPLGVNVLGKRRAIKAVLFAATGSWPKYHEATDANGQRHIFECEALGIAGAD